jgi:HlyD family secretion protein
VKRRLITFLVLGVLGTGSVLGYRAWKRHLASLPLQWSGTVEARKTEVGSRQGGRVKEVLVREGDHVSAAQPLIRLEVGDLEAQKLQAEGQLAQADANVNKVSGRGSSSKRQEIAAARARIEAQDVAIQKAEIDLRRQKQLIGSGATTQAELDTADNALRNATAQRVTLNAQLEELLSTTPEDLKSAQGQLDIAHGRLQQIQTMLDELVIRAPVAALVETLDLRPGDILAPNQVAAKLLEADQLFVRIYVPETELGYIHPNQQLPLYVDSFPGRSFNATVEFVSSQGEFTPRNLQTADERADQVFAARLRLEDGKDTLRAGMAAFARVAR